MNFFEIKIARIICLLLLLCFSSYGQSQVSHPKGAEHIHWMNFTDAYKQNLKDSVKKKVFIDVYTYWCGWCKRMDASTFEDPKVVKYINDHYYPVKLDAETRDTIYFRDKVFVYRPEFKANEIALSLLMEKMSYPTSVYLDEQFSMLTTTPGYQTAEQILPILQYFGQNIYKTITWEEYQKNGYHH